MPVVGRIQACAESQSQMNDDVEQCQSLCRLFLEKQVNDVMKLTHSSHATFCIVRKDQAVLLA